MQSVLLAAALSMSLNIFIGVLISPVTLQSDPDVKKVVKVDTSGVRLLI